jgi:hypothetical protein
MSLACLVGVTGGRKRTVDAGFQTTADLAHAEHRDQHRFLPLVRRLYLDLILIIILNLLLLVDPNALSCATLYSSSQRRAQLSKILGRDDAVADERFNQVAGLEAVRLDDSEKRARIGWKRYWRRRKRERRLRNVEGKRRGSSNDVEKGEKLKVLVRMKAELKGVRQPVAGLKI